jgi:hypothetical protein
VVAGVVALLCVGYPVVVTAVLAYTSFTGCFISCGTPRPGVGLVWSAVAALLLFLPLALGLAVAGVRSRRAWWTSAAVVLLVAATWDLLAVFA